MGREGPAQPFRNGQGAGAGVPDGLAPHRRCTRAYNAEYMYHRVGAAPKKAPALTSRAARAAITRRSSPLKQRKQSSPARAAGIELALSCAWSCRAGSRALSSTCDTRSPLRQRMQPPPSPPTIFECRHPRMRGKRAAALQTTALRLSLSRILRRFLESSDWHEQDGCRWSLRQRTPTTT